MTTITATLASELVRLGSCKPVPFHGVGSLTHSYILSLCSDKALVFCSIHHTAQSLPAVDSWMACNVALHMPGLTW